MSAHCRLSMATSSCHHGTVSAWRTVTRQVLTALSTGTVDVVAIGNEQLPAPPSTLGKFLPNQYAHLYDNGLLLAKSSIALYCGTHPVV